MTWSEKMLRHAVENSAAGRALRVAAITPPRVRAPMFAGMEVQIQPASDLTEEELSRAVFERLRQHAKRQPRSLKESVRQGDELTVDVVAYCDGKIVPFTAAKGLPMVLGMGEHLPGVDQVLEGRKVSESVCIRAQIPKNHGASAFRELGAVFSFTIQAAQQLTLPNETDPALLKAEGCQSPDELSQRIVDDLISAASFRHYQAVLRVVLDYLANQVAVPIPDALIDHVITLQWLDTEAKVLMELNLGAEDRDDSLRAWLADSELRQEMSHEILITLMLKAIAERDAVAPNAKDLRELAEVTAEIIGAPKAEMLAALKPRTGNPELQEAVQRLWVIQHILSKVKFRSPT